MFFKPRAAAHAVSFPKSGRTWVQVMVAHVYHQLTGLEMETLLKQKRRSRIYDYHSGKRLPYLHVGHGYKHWQICQGNFFPTRRYKGARIALLVRDPRDVLVSHYYFQRFQLQKFDSNLHEFIHHPFREEKVGRQPSVFGLQPILNYVNAWVEHQEFFDKFQVFTYESFKEDTHGNLQKLVTFVGLDVSDEVVNKAVEYGSFENMRKLETNGELDWIGLPNASDPRGLKTRRGRVGGYREELSKEDLVCVNDMIDQHLSPRFSCYYSNAK